MTLLATNHYAVMPLSRASTRGRYSRIMGVTEGLLELNAEAPIFVQVRPVAQTPVIVALVALPRETFIVR